MSWHILFVLFWVEDMPVPMPPIADLKVADGHAYILLETPYATKQECDTALLTSKFGWKRYVGDFAKSECVERPASGT